MDEAKPEVKVTQHDKLFMVTVTLRGHCLASSGPYHDKEEAIEAALKMNEYVQAMTGKPTKIER